jgi:hypothetical protein
MVGIFRRLLVIAAVLALPVVGYAQEAVITGTVTDTTGGVLPGVSVTAVHEASGNTFLAVTDARGRFRIGARVGTFHITLTLSGFTPVTQTGVTLLVGSTANLDLQMAVTGVEESVTVTGDAPLLNVTESSLGGNIDPNQMQELPVQGREWTSLTLLAPGNRTTAMGAQPVQDRGDVRDFHINMDGQQVTSQLGPGGQPRFSRDAIAEFQFISNRFDATQGRSAGVQVNAITHSGTNTLKGSVGGYFRDSDWNAKDPVLGVVLPGQDQQYSATLGGPILRDKLHFFGNYEYDRKPLTTIGLTAFPSFNVTLSGTETVKMGGLRLDYQFSPENRVMVKGGVSRFSSPFGSLGSNHPAGTSWTTNYTNNVLAQYTRVLSNRAVNQLQVGYAGYGFDQANLTHWSNHWLAGEGITTGAPRITFTGFSIAGGQLPWYWKQAVYSVRDEFTYSYSAKGMHDLKAGGEFLRDMKVNQNCTNCSGVVDARNGPLPTNIESLFPNPWNADTWNLAAISPLVRTYTLSVGSRHDTDDRPTYAAWIQDDWRVTDRLTLNLGLRYDLQWNFNTNDAEILPWVVAGRRQNLEQVQPRLGVAYALNTRTVLRGGVGKYYGDTTAYTWTRRMENLINIELPNDGRPDFAANPFNGQPVPTFEQALQRVCDVNNVPGCLRRSGVELAPPEEFSRNNHSWQSSLGFQRQFGSDIAIEADYAWNASRGEHVIHNNVNLTYDPVTGVNFPFANIATRFYPEWGSIGYYAYNGYSNYHGLQTTFTKRFSNRWQASANYLLSRLANVSPAQPISGHTEVPFPVAPDLGNEYGLAATDQRHRAVFNGIWQVGRGFQVSGLYFFGSGQRLANSCGGDRRGIGSTSGHYVPRLCANGTIAERNSFVMDPIHRVDVRFQQSVPLPGRARIDGILEVFNLIDRANFGSYTVDESSPRFGLPNASTNLAFAPRTLQLGFRVIF